MYAEIDLEQLELTIECIFSGGTIVLPLSLNSKEIRVVNRENGEIYSLSVQGKNTHWYILKEDLLLSTNNQELTQILIERALQNKEYELQGISIEEELLYEEKYDVLKEKTLEIYTRAPVHLKGSCIKKTYLENSIWISRDDYDQAQSLLEHEVLKEALNGLILGIDNERVEISSFKLIFNIDPYKIIIEIGLIDLIFNTAYCIMSHYKLYNESLQDLIQITRINDGSFQPLLKVNPLLDYDQDPFITIQPYQFV